MIGFVGVPVAESGCTTVRIVGDLVDAEAMQARREPTDDSCAFHIHNMDKSGTRNNPGRTSRGGDRLGYTYP